MPNSKIRTGIPSQRRRSGFFGGFTVNGTDLYSLVQQIVESGMTTAEATALILKYIHGELSSGRDGIAILDGTNEVPWAARSGNVYTALRDFFPTYLETTAAVTLEMASSNGIFKGIVRGDILNNGTTRVKGANGSGATAGAAWGTLGTIGNNIAGGAGGAAGANAGAAGGSVGGVELAVAGLFNGGVGGTGLAAGGAGGVPTVGVVGNSTVDNLNGLFAAAISRAGTNFLTCGLGGGGGSGGTAGAGGGGGAGGPDLVLVAGGTITNNGFIGSEGGDGGNAAVADAGNGAPGGGGRAWVYCADWVGNELEARSGSSGTGGKVAGCGLPGRVRMFPMRTPSGALVPQINVVTLTAPELAELTTVSAGFHRVTMTCVVDTEPSGVTGAGTTGLGGGGFPFFDMTTPEGRFAALYDAANNQILIIVGGTTRATLISGVAQMWKPGDVIDIDFAYPSSGSGTARWRMAVNRCMGNDSTFAAAGALTAFTAGKALGSAPGVWKPTTNIFSSVAPGSNKVCDIVVLGDSTSAPRFRLPSVGSLLGATAKSIRTLAVSGNTLNQQLTAWQGSAERGQSSVAAVIINGGINDIIAADSAATIAADFQAIVNDVQTNNAAAKRIGAKMTPAGFYFTPAQQAVWVEANDDIAGTGPNPITGLDQVVTAHVTDIGDANGALRYRGDASDHLHPSRTGRSRYAARIVAKLTAAGITL